MSGTKRDSGNMPSNPLKPATQLKHSSESASLDKYVHPQQAHNAEDSAVTKAEKYERHGIGAAVKASPAEAESHSAEGHVEVSPSKRIKLDNATDHEAQDSHVASGDVEESPSRRMNLEDLSTDEAKAPTRSERLKGVAPIKQE